MEIKQFLSRWLRKAGLFQMTDYLRFIWMRFRNRKGNNVFRREHPEIALPPDYILYESFQLDYGRYYFNGRKTAEWLAGLAERHLPLKGATVLDWGCGPARVIRHLPGIIAQGHFYGTDYNRRSIAWCSSQLPGISFHTNGLMPRTDFGDDLFDMVYGISIFTHLSEEAHVAWLDELRRVMKPGGILILTLHGHSFEGKLSPADKRRFESGKLVVRGQVREGHRTFTAFHPESWVKKWSERLSLLEHIPGNMGEQDVWIFRK